MFSDRCCPSANTIAAQGKELARQNVLAIGSQLDKICWQQLLAATDL
jgi:hypothetical protein